MNLASTFSNVMLALIAVTLVVMLQQMSERQQVDQATLLALADAAARCTNPAIKAAPLEPIPAPQ